MANKKLILVIVAEQGYIRSTDGTNGDFSAQNDVLFSAISDTYLPLLELFAALEAEGVPFKLGLVLSPALCTLLADPLVQRQYIAYLDRRIALGNEELERRQDSPELMEEVRLCLRKLLKDRLAFTEEYHQDLLERFRHYAAKGCLELIPTAATYAYLPHYADLPEVLNAQIETGLRSSRYFFGESGEGFFLPHMGWADGFDAVLRSYGANYTIVDTRAVLFGRTGSRTGIFAPVRSPRSLVLFARDHDTPDDISGTDGFMYRSVYRCQQRDIGYDLPGEELEALLGTSRIRVPTGFKYWANGPAAGHCDLPYNPDAARAQAREDAQAFYAAKSRKLAAAADALDKRDALLLCTIPAELLGQAWHEGVLWLGDVIRLAAQGGEVELSLCREHLRDQFSLPKITPYPCAASGSGYAEDLLDGTNSWMMRYVRKASERIIDLTERFPAETGLKARLLNIGAREVLLAQSSDWPKMIHDRRLPDYAEEAFRHNILSFTAVFDALASNTVSTEWLTNLEKEHAIFPWINYRVFSRKK